MKSVSRYEEASGGDGSFAQQGGLIARQNLATRVSRTTCRAISTNFPSGCFHQGHRWSLKTKSVVLIKRICGLHKRRSKLCDLVYTKVQLVTFIKTGCYYVMEEVINKQK